MNRSAILWLATFMVCWAQAAAQAPPPETRPASASEAAPQQLLPELPASRASKDPESGRLIAPQATTPLPADLPSLRARLASLSQIRASLRIEPAPSAAGGIRVRLGTAFRSELIAVKATDGTIQLQCLEGAASSPEKPRTVGASGGERATGPLSRPSTALPEEEHD